MPPSHYPTCLSGPHAYRAIILQRPSATFFQRRIRASRWHGYFIFSILLMLVVPLITASSATALTINLTFDSDATDSPTYDADAALLAPIMRKAADHWEDIIHDTGTLDIRYYYDDLSGSTLADHNNEETSGGKPTEARIRIDTQTGGEDRNWYFDPTPTNHSEYDLQQTLYRDVDADDQGNWFNGSPPDLLEVGYRGNLSATAPAEAIGAYDIFSSVIHEIGHAVGLTSSVASGEYADDDYDIASNLVGGAVMAIEGAVHIDPRISLMCSSCGAVDLRRMPTATDVFAAATGSGWTNLDLYRQDMWSGGKMNDPGQWEGNNIPGSGDDAFIRHDGTATMDDDLHFQNITIAEGSWVQTSDHTLDIDNDTVLQRDSVKTTQLFVQSGGTFTTEDLRLFGAELDMAGGEAVITDFFEIQPDDENTTNWDGMLTGNGIIDVASQLENDGIIRPDGGTLTFRSISVDAWDLDGDNGTGALDASNGDVIFDTGGLRDEHDGTITIGEGHFVRFDFGWELGPGGDIYLNGNSSDTAELLGPGTATISGDINATGQSLLDTTLVFQSTADVSLTDTDTHLKLGSHASDSIVYDGGTFTGPGKLTHNGDATVTSGSTVNISVDIFDFDGSSPSDMTVDTGATLNITSNVLNDSYSGDLTVQGMLKVDLVTSSSWSLDGTLVINGGGEVNGDELNLTGTLATSAGGQGTITASLDIHSTASLDVSDAGDTLILAGSTTWRGPASVTGSGELVQNGNAHFTNDTTIAVGTYNMDGTATSQITIDPNVTVTLDVHAIDTGTDGFDGTLNLKSSTLTVNTTDAWAMEGTTNMDTASDVARIKGSQIVVANTVNVTGEGSAYIDADSVIATSSHVSVADNTKLVFKGATSLKGGSFTTGPATASEPPSRIELDGITTYDGGTIAVKGVVRQDGHATVNDSTTIDGDYFDMDGSSGILSVWDLNNHFNLTVQGIEDRTTNNTFHGTMNINNPGRLTVSTNDESWTMAGTMNLDQNGHANQYLVRGDDINITGQATVSGATAIGATLHLSGTITLGDAADLFQLGGSGNTLSGGDIVGPGSLVALGSTGSSLTGHGTISTDAQFTGANLMADGGTLSISGTITDVGDIGTKNSGGTLTITDPWSTSIAERLILNGGSVTGGAIDNDGTTVGHGLIATETFANNGSLTASAGTLILNTINIPDLDGDSLPESGQINATSGDIHVQNMFGYKPLFNGQLNVGLDRRYVMDHDGLHIAPPSLSSPQGKVDLHGGTYQAPQLLQGGQLTVDTATSQLISDSDFLGTNTLAADLELVGSATIRASARFAGDGDLIIAAGTSLAIEDGAIIGVDIVNAGDLMPGSSPGTVTFLNDYVQTDNGLLQMEIDGWKRGEFDQMHIAGTAILDGALEVVFNELLAEPPSELALDLITWADYKGSFTTTIISGNDIFDGLYRLALTRTGLTMVAIPEPAMLSLFALATGALLRRQRHGLPA